MRHLRFYFQHSLSHMLREPQRTLLVLFCIAVGVAAVVALRTFGLMIQDALVRDLRASNRADLALAVPATAYMVGTAGGNRETRLADGRRVAVNTNYIEIKGQGAGQTITFSPAGQTYLEGWAARNGWEVQFSLTNGGPFTLLFRPARPDQPEYVMVVGVDPARYPFYGQVEVLQPAGRTLAEALSGPRDLAASSTLAETLGLQIGDRLAFSGLEGEFTVAAIIHPRAEANLANPLSGAIFPFAYIPLASAEDLLNQRPKNAYLRAPAGADIEAARRELEAGLVGVTVTSPEDLGRSNQGFSDALTRLATMLGLASLRIGGLGIANTMLVVVSRRSLEVAVLKTVGVQGSQILLMFVVEALLLGAAGLALFASGVIIANTVSLATLEGRRQIGIMKAIGLQAKSVLGMLLLENGLVGLAGGLLGAGLAVLLLSVINALGTDPLATLPYGALGLSLAATLLAAWSAAREHPLNVLRYE